MNTNFNSDYHALYLEQFVVIHDDGTFATEYSVRVWTSESLFQNIRCVELKHIASNTVYLKRCTTCHNPAVEKKNCDVNGDQYAGRLHVEQPPVMLRSIVKAS
jgi:hypothetical protein